MISGIIWKKEPELRGVINSVVYDRIQKAYRLEQIYQLNSQMKRYWQYVKYYWTAGRY